MLKVNLLWTGGWDSTYRLLELLLVQKRIVQPYYLIDRRRRSRPMEINSMNKIRKLVLKRSPQTKELFLPTIYKEVAEIKPNDTITTQYQNLRRITRLGIQYEWMARFAAENGINDLELCIDMCTPGFFTTDVLPCLIKEVDGKSYNFKLGDSLSNPDLKLFSYYKFPIPEQTKVDLQKLAKEYGFLDIMENTWFCHHPKFNRPCGICVPCLQTVEHGLGRRIPITGRIRKFIEYKIKQPIKNMLKPEQVKIFKYVLTGKG